MTDLTDLTAKVERLEERMNTLQAQTNESYERLRADLADQGRETAQRETRLVLTMIGVVGFFVTGLGVFLSLTQ